MSRGEVDCVVTGADRIAANGDAANKIGTYGLAVAAAHHGLPLYIVAPTSTIDLGDSDRLADPDRGAGRRRAQHALRRPEPCFRRHARRADRRDRDRGGRPSGAVRRLAAAGGARVKAIILAGGYATRLQPLTDDLSKCLLPVGGRPMVDWILDSLRAVDGDRRRPPRHEPPVRAGLRALGDGRRTGVTVHDDGTTLERGPARRDGRRRVHARAGGDRRRRPRRRGRQSLRLLTRRLHRVLAEQGRRQRRRRPRRRRPAARVAIRGRRRRRRRADHVVRREARRSTEHARGDRDLHLPPRARPARRAIPRRRQRARPGRAASSPGCTRASRSTRTGLPAGGSTSATRSSCLPPTTSSAASRGCRSAPSTSSRFSQPARFRCTLS